jgi:RNA polymerase sigma-70 factor (ECF subfamily)
LNKSNKPDRNTVAHDSSDRVRAAGNDAAQNEQFVRLFARNQPSIFGYILSLLPNWTDAEDVLQQTSMVLWQKFDEFRQDDPNSDFTRWACGIARYKILNYRKKQGRDKHLFSQNLLEILAEESLNSIPHLNAERRALASCLDKLNHRSRQLIHSCYAGTKTIKEIAVQLGRTPNSLYKALNRIRGQLLSCVAQTLAMEDRS